MASSYDKLVKALRYCTDHEPMNGDCAGCPYDGEVCHTMLSDAAAAIEALETEIRESMQKCAECGDANMPKRGEWIITTETSDDGAVSQHMNCSVCWFYWREPKHRKVFKRCPNCGADMRAKMEVQDADTDKKDSRDVRFIW